MSLDVYLEVDRDMTDVSTNIKIWDDVWQYRDLLYSEWVEKFPNYVLDDVDNTETLYTNNITHNLNKMASEAGLYECLWRPEENGYEFAHQLITPLRIGLDKLVTKPDHYKQWNPENRWGTYEGLVEFVRKYLAACKANPDAKIRVSR